MNPHLKGSLLIILAMLLFSTQAVLIRYISLNTFSLLAYYELLFLTFLILFMLLTKKKDSFKLVHPKKILAFSVIAILVVLFSYYSALRLTTFANAMFTHYTAPIFALVVAVFFLKEKFDWQSIGAILLSMIGMFLLFRSGFEGQSIIGIIFGLVSGVAYGITINLNKLLVGYGKIFSLMLYQTIPVVIILSPFLFMQPPTFNDIILLITMAIIPGVLASTIYLSGLKTVKAQHIGIIAYVEIFFVIVFGIIFFKEIPTLVAWLGGTLIIASGIWIIIAEAKRKDPVKS